MPLTASEENEGSILRKTKKYTQVIMSDMMGCFGESVSNVARSTLRREEWNLCEDGRLFETKRPMNITPEHEMRQFVENELNRTEGNYGKET